MSNPEPGDTTLELVARDHTGRETRRLIRVTERGVPLVSAAGVRSTDIVRITNLGPSRIALGATETVLDTTHILLATGEPLEMAIAAPLYALAVRSRPAGETGMTVMSHSPADAYVSRPSPPSSCQRE